MLLIDNYLSKAYKVEVVLYRLLLEDIIKVYTNFLEVASPNTRLLINKR